jgi:hypothetical protein
MNKNTGVFVATPNEPKTDVYIEVSASDGVAGSIPAETSFTIKVAAGEVNHAPYFVRLDANGEVVKDPVLDVPIPDANVAFTVSEHEEITPAGDYLVDHDGNRVMVKALDIDTGNTVTYKITGGTGSANFSIDPSTGEIRMGSTGTGTTTTADDLNFETGPKAFTLNVAADDGKGGIANGTVTIFVFDENDVPTANTIPVQNVTAGDFWVFNFGDDGTKAFSDEDKDVLFYTADLTNASWLAFSEPNTLLGTVPTDAAYGTTYTVTLTVDDDPTNPDNTLINNTFQIKVLASATGLRDAVRYLDADQTGGYEDYLPAEGEDVAIHEVAMYAQASQSAEPDMAADADMFEALNLLNMGAWDDMPA